MTQETPDLETWNINFGIGYKLVDSASPLRAEVNEEPRNQEPLLHGRQSSCQTALKSAQCPA
jgi:hypothetical protein